MKILVVSDLHSNSSALLAVFSKVRRKRIDRIVCLGDFVGYGAQPNQVLDQMRQFKAEKMYIRGNHDRVASGADDGYGFNGPAKQAALWTRDHLSGPNRRFLSDLPMGPLQDGEVLLCHGAPHDEDEYVFDEFHASHIFSETSAPVIFYGHTHLPVIFEKHPRGGIRGRAVREDTIIELHGESRYLINPGSVGQPRDRNPKAAFVIYDTARKTVQFLRVEYDIELTRQSIFKAGLPRVLGDRLMVGA